MRELDSIVGSMAGNGGLRSVILEMDRDDANRFLFAISKEFQNMLGTYYGPVRNVIGMGEAFKYKGVSFRVIENAK